MAFPGARGSAARYNLLHPIVNLTVNIMMFLGSTLLLSNMLCLDYHVNNLLLVPYITVLIFVSIIEDTLLTSVMIHINKMILVVCSVSLICFCKLIVILLIFVMNCFSQIIDVVIIPFIVSFLWIKITVKMPYISTICLIFQQSKNVISGHFHWLCGHAKAYAV